MGLRFHRRLTIAPGVRMNFSLSGPSLSLGPCGATVTIGRRGLFGNLGLPGTGISYRTRLDRVSRGRTARAPAAEPEETTVAVTAELAADGTVSFKTAHGVPASSEWARRAFEQQGPAVRAWLEERAAANNRARDEFVNVHLASPRPVYRSRFIRESFAEPAPMPPTLPPLKIRQPTVPRDSLLAQLARALPGIGGVFRRRRERALAAYAEARRRWQAACDEHTVLQARAVEQARQALANWRVRKAAFEAAQAEAVARYEAALATSTEQMAEVLTRALAALAWPRETKVEFDIAPDGWTVFLDVDLPEVEVTPARTVSVSINGQRLLYKELSETAKRRDYARHVHGVALRLAAVVCVTLPTPEVVVVSGCTQRTDPATGRESDDYIYSARITRAGLDEVDFGALREVDPVVFLERFEHRRSMAKTGVFKPIEPFSA